MKLITLGTGAGNPTLIRHNSCSFLETSNGSYLIDAGGPVSASIIRKGLDFNAIRAVFITHMHEDHFGGLTSFLKNRMVKNGPYNRTDLWRGFWPEVWLPDPDGITAFDWLMAVQFRGEQRERILYRLIQPGTFYNDGFMKVTAIPNRHFPWKDGYLPSFCFLLEAEGKKLLCTGDLSADFSDFPVEAAKNADLVLCEFTHFDLMQQLDTFRKIRPGKLIFNHVAERNEKQFPVFAEQLKYPAAVACDGDEFVF
jgi:ribonuclease BN (tRNA processing enzyme)